MANIIQIIRTPPTTRSSLSRDAHTWSRGFQQHPLIASSCMASLAMTLLNLKGPTSLGRSLSFFRNIRELKYRVYLIQRGEILYNV
jgi:hypothetical protein